MGEERLSNSPKKTCKFHNQKSSHQPQSHQLPLSGTHTGVMNGGGKQIHMCGWQFPKASVPMSCFLSSFPVEKQPCFSSLQSNRCLFLDLVAFLLRQGHKCDPDWYNLSLEPPCNSKARAKHKGICSFPFSSLPSWKRYTTPIQVPSDKSACTVKNCWLLNRVQLFAIPWIIACQVPLSLEFSRHCRQILYHLSHQGSPPSCSIVWKYSCSVVADSLKPHRL